MSVIKVIEKTRTSKRCEYCGNEIKEGSKAVQKSSRGPLEDSDFNQIGIKYDREFWHYDCRPFWMADIKHGILPRKVTT